MKVICIDGAKRGGEYYGHLIPKPKEGKVYEVLQHPYYDDCYLILELDSVGGYRKFRFAPLSSIDETEFEREYKTEKV